MAANPRIETFLSTSYARVKKLFYAVALFSAVINLLMLVGPLYMMQVYDRVLTSGSMPTLLFLSAAAIFLILSSALLEAVRARLLVRIGGQLDDSISRPIFDGLMDQAVKSGETRSQALKDAATVRGFLTGPGVIGLFDAPWAPIFLAIIFLVHPILGITATIGAAILFGIALVNELVTRKPLSKAGGYDIAASNYVDSVLRNAEVVKALGMGNAIGGRWLDRHVRSQGEAAVAGDRGGVITGMTKFVRPVLQVAMLGIGAYLVLQQEITAGVMIASSIILGRALAPVEQAINNWKNVVSARNANTRLKEFIEELGDPKEPMRLPAPKGNMTVHKLVAAPPGQQVPVIKGVSFQVRAGECIGIIGPSAAGKSTLARALLGVWLPSSGVVRLDGADIAQWDRAELGPHIGYLPQDIELFDGTVSDNICRFGQPDPEAIHAAAQLAGAHEMILGLPQGYDTPIGGSGSRLSGGQRQRIGLARALFGSPRLVILDEPNSSLDGEGEEALRNAILQLKDNQVTVFVIAHRPSVLAVADRLLVLRNGMIEQFGPREEVMAQLTRPVERRPITAPAEVSDNTAEQRSTGNV